MSTASADRHRIAVIAGGTGNVGAAAALELARRGFRVVLLGRNDATLAAKAAAIDARMRAGDSAATGVIETEAIDFSDLESVRDGARRISERVDAIDVLILSVVTYRQDGPTLLSDGNEAMFATNVLGPFLFAQLLMPRVEAAHGVVLHVVAPFERDIDWADLQSVENHRPMAAYERTKTCHRIIAGEMARRHGDRITSLAFDPGFVIDRTDPELRHRWPSGWTGLLWRVYAALAAQPPATAGRAIAHLLTESPDLSALNGAYFRQEKRRETPDPLMADAEAGRRLWERLEELTAPRA